MTPTRTTAGAIAVVALGLVLPHCARNSALDDAPYTPDAGVAPPFISIDTPEGGDAVSHETPMCVATECPELTGTCSNAPYKCQSKLDADPNNCGACGRSCPNDLEAYGLAARCERGKCITKCMVDDVGDCNGSPEDGCETVLHCPSFPIDMTIDPKNCGHCGIACPEGVECIGSTGQCGCGAGLTQCGHNCLAICVDTQIDDLHCGGCDRACPTEATPVANAMVGCGDGECGKLKCRPLWGDCNGDLAKPTTDGCETLLTEDNMNCGACGNVCPAGSECDSGTCTTPWGCAPGLVRCSTLEQKCTDLQTDVENCGGCGRSCGQHPNVRSRCSAGECVFECPAGRADCDGRLDNGCEIDVEHDPLNCGGCGVMCDVSVGQPCVSGKCLMRECDAGERPVQ